MAARDGLLYLELARELAEGTLACDADAQKRSAVNRAYYAAYYSAFAFASERWRYVPQGQTGYHSELRRKFSDQRQFTIANDLRELYKWRETCDYSLSEVADLDSLVQAALGSAEQLIRRLRPGGSPSGS